jgi:hypothetical protein
MGAGITIRDDRLPGKHIDGCAKDSSRRTVEHTDAGGRRRKRSMAATAHASTGREVINESAAPESSAWLGVRKQITRALRSRRIAMYRNNSGWRWKRGEEQRLAGEAY